MRNIDDLVDDSGADWELLYAYGINDVGHIVGYGRSPEGEHHAFLLVPEPASAILVLMGLGVLVHRRKARR